LSLAAYARVSICPETPDQLHTERLPIVLAS